MFNFITLLQTFHGTIQRSHQINKMLVLNKKLIFQWKKSNFSFNFGDCWKIVRFISILLLFDVFLVVE